MTLYSSTMQNILPSERSILDTIVAKSDAKISKAKLVLQGSDRGLKTLVALKSLLNGPASGLDTVGLRALHVLVQEFTQNHRRGFLV